MPDIGHDGGEVPPPFQLKMIQEDDSDKECHVIPETIMKQRPHVFKGFSPVATITSIRDWGTAAGKIAIQFVYSLLLAPCRDRFSRVASLSVEC